VQKKDGFWMFALFLILAVWGQAARADYKQFYYEKFIASQLPADEGPESLTKTDVFLQKIDHHNPQDPTVFSQRYYLNTAYASGPDAPVLFYLCGEATCKESSLKGAIESHAKELKAALISLEHRYYGKSQPFAQLTAANMKYLSIDQALEDAADFQRFAMQKYQLRGKWIVVGGSYPGSLSAYYRAKFPDLVVGALASSGPVMAKENFEEYDRHVGVVAGAECLSRIKTVVGQVESSLKDPVSALLVRKKFEAEVLTHDDDFLYLVADMAALAVQYGYRDRFCGLLAGADPLEGYAQFTREIFQSWQMDALSGSVAGAVSLDPNDYLSSAGMRQWFYQSCTEYGYWQNAYHEAAQSSRSSRINMDYHRGICKRLFAIDHPVEEQSTNQAYYQPLLDSGVSRILFTNGSRDPWSHLSITVENQNHSNPNVSVMTLKDAAHCDDLRVPSLTELPSVKEARQKFLELAKLWLQ